MFATAIVVLATVVPIVGAPAASAGEDLTRCQATITNKSGVEAKFTDARKGAGDKWAPPGDPTGKTIGVGETFKDAQSTDGKPDYCGIELRVASSDGDGRWTILVKATPGGGTADCRGSCKITDRDITDARVSVRVTLNK
jgi:hypothetical protein